MNEIYLTHLAAPTGGAARIRVRYRPVAGAGGDAEIPFEFAVAERERDLIRWYYEEYPQWPDVVAAGAAEDALKDVGERLFRAVFDAPETAPLAERFLADPSQGRLVIDASSAEGAAIPWEFLRSPKRRGLANLVLLLGGFSRGGPAPAPGAGEPPAGGPTPLRILLVTCRPEGEEDVPFQWVSAVLRQVCAECRERVELDVLRPPTLAQLSRVLGDGPGHYHILHFDGHGALQGGPAGRGVLVFEAGEGGGRQDVSGGDLGQVLVSGGVPVAVLNACDSGKSTPGTLYLSLGQELFAAGVPGVVAMAHKLHVDAAPHFVKRLYERLLAGAALEDAVQEARRALHASPVRRTLLGDIALADWAVPVVFHAGSLRLLDPARPGAPVPPPVAEDIDCPAAPADPLVGRDGAFLRMERALAPLDAYRCVLLIPPKEGGKGWGTTTTAVAFARWWAATSEPPGGAVLYVDGGNAWSPAHVCDRVVAAVPEAQQRELLGDVYDNLGDERRRDAALRLLEAYVRVLVIDAADNVRRSDVLGAPRADPVVEDARRFLNELAGRRRTLVLLTVADVPAWLDPYARVRLKPLDAESAGALIVHVLTRLGIAPKDYAADADYPRLVARLRAAGHPGEISARLSELPGKTPRTILHDMESPPPSPPAPDAPRRRISLFLFAVAGALFLVSLLSVTAAYEAGDQEWARMATVNLHPEDDPRQQFIVTGVACNGYILEVVRAFIVIGVGIIWIPVYTFETQARRLLAFGPFRDRDGPGATTGVLLARSFFVALGLILLAIVCYHHFWVGPGDLWLSGGDRGYFLLHRRVAALNHDTVPSPADADYVTYWRHCVLPYWLYFPYSAINFAIILNVMFTVTIYAVLVDLYERLPKWTEIFNDLNSLRRTANTVRRRFGELQESIRGVLETYYSLLLFVVFAIAFELWLDQYNLTPRGAADTWNAVWFLLLPLLVIFFTTVVFYGWAIEWAAGLLPEGARDAFRAANGLPQFLWSATWRSRYFWLMAFFAVAGYPCWYLWVKLLARH
jgi:hypothetical protein